MSVLSIPQEIIEQKIYLIRGKKVILDKDLAQLYEVSTSQLTRQVRRNLERFPDDFLIQLSQEEFRNLKCQFGISSWGGTRKPPFAFTEQGIAMLSGVLHSPRAVQVNIAIMRAFVKLRELMITHRDLARKIEELEQRFKGHEENFVIVFKAIKELLKAPRESTKKRLPIGFHVR